MTAPEFDDSSEAADAVSKREVREFYDAFTKTRMVNYRLNPNPRLEAAKQTITAHLAPASRVLEIGCGIGVITEHVASKLHAARVYACDLSATNIWYAKQTVHCPNIEWAQLDVLEHGAKLAGWVGQKVDVVLMVDVLEHIEKVHHAALFDRLAGVLTKNGKIILTLPSPQYQQYLRDYEPEELQVIDETIDLSELYKLAAQVGFAVKYFELLDVGGTRNQYVHCVLDGSAEVERLPAHKTSLLGRIFGFFDQRVALKYRRWKYVSRIFKTGP